MLAPLFSVRNQLRKTVVLNCRKPFLFVFTLFCDWIIVQRRLVLTGKVTRTHSHLAIN
jgi:hypothetical protein